MQFSRKYDKYTNIRQFVQARYKTIFLRKARYGRVKDYEISLRYLNYQRFYHNMYITCTLPKHVFERCIDILLFSNVILKIMFVVECTPLGSTRGQQPSFAKISQNNYFLSGK